MMYYTVWLRLFVLIYLRLYSEYADVTRYQLLTLSVGEKALPGRIIPPPASQNTRGSPVSDVYRANTYDRGESVSATNGTEDGERFCGAH